ncbi:unnamed protein product [Ranitomeya imitator]|uniref:Uncharacterized protein n=1 Tax=Ranitomeya imitator TaxID=111125 RepID=A0ABN9L9G1_9NEOB|nr:unnamed protein product [Ranitomeya imitator]
MLSVGWRGVKPPSLDSGGDVFCAVTDCTSLMEESGFARTIPTLDPPGTTRDFPSIPLALPRSVTSSSRGSPSGFLFIANIFRSALQFCTHYHYCPRWGSQSRIPIKMSLECGRKPECPEETHANTERTYKLFADVVLNVMIRETEMYCHRKNLQAFNPSWCGILEYKDSTSMVARMVPSGRGPIADSLFSRVIILYPECQCHYPVPPVSVSLSCTPSVSVIILYPECQRHYPVPRVSVSLSCTPSVSVIILYPECQCHYPVPRVSVSLSCTVIILYHRVSSLS